MRGAGVWRLQMDQIDRMDKMDNVGAPVFALMGYAVASHVIPRGGTLPQCGVAQASNMPQGRANRRGMLA